VAQPPSELSCASVTGVATGMPGLRAAGSCRVRQTVVYQRQRPEKSVAYQVVLQNLETWLAWRSAGGLDAGAGLVWKVVWSAKSGLQALCILRLFRVSNFCEHQTSAVVNLN